MDGWTDGPIERQTDRQSNPVVRNLSSLFVCSCLLLLLVLVLVLLFLLLLLLFYIVVIVVIQTGCLGRK